MLNPLGGATDAIANNASLPDGLKQDFADQLTPAIVSVPAEVSAEAGRKFDRWERETRDYRPTSGLAVKDQVKFREELSRFGDPFGD